MKLPKAEEPILRVTTQPNDANPGGDIFGGWLMSKIDIAGGITAKNVTKGAVATVAVKELQFINPLFVGDLVSFYTEVLKVGTTSVNVQIEVFAHRKWDLMIEPVHISKAIFVYVAISKPGEKRMIS